MLKEKFGINSASAEAQFGTGRGIRLKTPQKFFKFHEAKPSEIPNSTLRRRMFMINTNIFSPIEK